MSGLRLSQFEYTVTANDDFVIGSPFDADLKTSKYITFQTTNKVGFANNPFLCCDYISDGNGTGHWNLGFSNDGSARSYLVLSGLPNTFTKPTTFTGDVYFSDDTITFNENSVTYFNGVVTVAESLTISPGAQLIIGGLTPSRALVSNSSGNGLVTSNVTTTEIGYVAGVTSGIQSQLNLKAPKDSPTFTSTATFSGPVVLNNTLVVAQSAAFNQTAAFNQSVAVNNSMVIGSQSSHTLLIKASPTFNTDVTFSQGITVNGSLTVNGTTTTLNTTNMDVEDANITVNKGGALATAKGAGLNVESSGSIVAYNRVSSDGQYWEMKSPTLSGTLCMTPPSNSSTATLSAYNVNANSVFYLPNAGGGTLAIGSNFDTGYILYAYNSYTVKSSGIKLSDLASISTDFTGKVNRTGDTFTGAVGAPSFVASGSGFSGPGTNLTGTASGLTVGTATNATNAAFASNASALNGYSSTTSPNASTVVLRDSAGDIYAHKFNGDGSGLNGTASSLSVGTATNATNATNSATVGGYSPATSDTSNTVVVRDGSGNFGTHGIRFTDGGNHYTLTIVNGVLTQTAS